MMYYGVLMDKAISKNECTQIAQDFCSFSTQKMDKKTSELSIFFAGNRLSYPSALFLGTTTGTT